MNMTTIAFDVAKAELVGARMSRTGMVKERYTIVNTPTAINQFLDSLKEKKITIGSEATAEYHLNLARACMARSIPFKLINPLITKQFTRATIRKRKTDKDDAEIIGKCLLQGGGRQLSEHDLLPATRILRTASDLMQMAHSLHLLSLIHI
jgi:transposase